MAPAFSFPPPPPPPPKPIQDQFAGVLRGGARGGRGHGRGRGGSQRGGGVHNHQNSGHKSSPSSGVSQYPAGAYVNPAFPQHARPGSADFSTPLPSPSRGPWTGGQGQKRKREDGSAPPRGSWRGGHIPSTRPRPMKQKPNPPKSAVAPAVPSFGAPISFSIPPTHSSGSAPATQGTKLFGRGLGLTSDQQDAIEYGDSFSSDSESEDDENEEATLSAALGNSEKLKFEHNGEFVSLETVADIKAWQKERRRHWPSSRRAQEKLHERFARMEERRQIEAETLALLYGCEPVDSTICVRPDESTRSLPIPTLSRKDELRARLLEQKKAKEAELGPSLQQDIFPQRENITQPTDHLPGAQETLQDGPVVVAEDLKEDVAEDVAGSLHDGDALPSASEHGSDSSGSESGSERESDTSSAPEAQSSKVIPNLPNIHQPQVNRPCKWFAQNGRCKHGKGCLYQHVQPELDSVTLQPKRRKPQKVDQGMKTLHQRLVEQEQIAENRLALQAIKYLGTIGFFRKEGKDGQ